MSKRGGAGLFKPLFQYNEPFSPEPEIFGFAVISYEAVAFQEPEIKIYGAFVG
jgi:hypothetical protein